MADRLDNVGLSYLWNKLKAYFVSNTQLANDLKEKADAIITNSDPKASFSPSDLLTYGEDYQIIVEREEGFAGIAYADTESVLHDADQGENGIFTVTGHNSVHIAGEPSADATLDITVYGETAFEPETAISEDDALHFGVYLTGTITGSGDPIEITLTLTPEEGTADVHTFTIENSLGLQQFSFTAGCDVSSVSMSITAATGFEYDAFLSWGFVIGEEYTAQTFGTDDEMVFDSSDIAAAGISFLGLPGYAEYTADTKAYVDGSVVEYSNATTSADGLMSADDKALLSKFSVVNGKMCITYEKEVSD